VNRKDREVQAYAIALLEALVEETLGALQAFQQRLHADGRLREVLEDPGRDVAEKYRVIEQLLPNGTPEAVKKFLGLLASRQDIGYLDEIIRNTREVVAARSEAKRVAEVTSAVPLTAEEKVVLEAKLRQRFGDRLGFVYHVDPEILGGLIVRVGDTLLDYSLRSRLEELRQRVQRLL